MPKPVWLTNALEQELKFERIFHLDPNEPVLVMQKQRFSPYLSVPDQERHALLKVAELSWIVSELGAYIQVRPTSY